MSRLNGFAGFVLAALPLEAMKQSPYLGNLVATIGKLSNAELMMASNFSHLQEIAKLAVDKVMFLFHAFKFMCNNCFSE